MEQKPSFSGGNRQSLFIGGLLIFLGLMALLGQYVNLTWVMWAGLLAVGGLFFLAGYLTNRIQTGLLIPAYVLWVIAGLITMVSLNILRDEAIAAYVLSAIALPFVFGFLRSPEKNWGLLIPAYVLIAVGLMVQLIGMGLLDDLMIPSYVMFAIALPFLFVFLRNPKEWWALIPGGIMTAIGAGFLIASAARLATIALPVILIAVGIAILFGQLFTRSGKPTTGPEADKPPSE